MHPSGMENARLHDWETGNQPKKAIEPHREHRGMREDHFRVLIDKAIFGFFVFCAFFAVDFPADEQGLL
jgi:hypothetical protein